MEYRTRFITQNVTPLESLAVKITYHFLCCDAIKN